MGHLLPPGLLCNGQVQWAKAMANIGRARANGDLGATKEAPRPGNPTIGAIGQLDWEHDFNMVHFRHFPGYTINV